MKHTAIITILSSLFLFSSCGPSKNTTEAREIVRDLRAAIKGGATFSSLQPLVVDANIRLSRISEDLDWAIRYPTEMTISAYADNVGDIPFALWIGIANHYSNRVLKPETAPAKSLSKVIISASKTMESIDDAHQFRMGVYGYMSRIHSFPIGSKNPKVYSRMKADIQEIEIALEDLNERWTDDVMYRSGN